MKDIISLQKQINEGALTTDTVAAIKAGKCLLPRAIRYLPSGNRPPTRTEIRQGYPGSSQYVRKMHGEKWLDALERVT